MILPDKNIKLAYSYIGCGAFLLKLLYKPQTVSLLWEKAKQNEVLTNYNRFLITLDFLYILNVIDIQNGMIIRGKNDSFSK